MTNQGLIAARSRLSKQGLTILQIELIADHMAVNLVGNVSNHELQEDLMTAIKDFLKHAEKENVDCISLSSTILGKIVQHNLFGVRKRSLRTALICLSQLELSQVQENHPTRRQYFRALLSYLVHLGKWEVDNRPSKPLLS